MAVVRVLSINTERGWRGGENQVWLLQQGIAQQQLGVESILLCRQGEPLADRMVGAGLPCLQVGGGLPAAVLAIRRAVQRHGIHLLHAHTSHTHQEALLANLGLALPVVVTRRVDFPIRSGWKYGSRVRCFVAISRAVRQVLVAGGVAGSRVVTIPSAIDVQRLQAVPAVDPRPPLGLPAGTPLAVCVAALVDHKGHRHLLEAWARHERAGHPGHLLLVGAGERQADLRAQAGGLGLERCHFLGFRADALALQKACDLFVLASVEEGLGTALLDAQVCGLPVLATTAGGIPEAVSAGCTGLLVPPADPAALAAGLACLMNDPDHRTRLGVAGRQHAATFDHRIMVRRYARLYHALVVAGPGGVD